MIAQPFALGDSIIHRLDPRIRVSAAVAVALFIALSTRLAVPAAGLVVGAALAAFARLDPRRLLKRMLEVNLFIILLWLLVPFTQPGKTMFRLGPLTASAEGVRLSLAIFLKCNAIVLTLTALVATIDVVRLGHALHDLRVPPKLVHLLLFTVRYLDVIGREYARLSQALKVRGFRPGTNRRTYRTYAYLVGTLLVRSVDRAQRVSAAMKCRGFRGRFYLLTHFHPGRRDAVFAATAGIILGILAWLQWTTISWYG